MLVFEIGKFQAGSGSGCRGSNARLRDGLLPGLSYEDRVAVSVLAPLTSHSRRQLKDALSFAEARGQSAPI
jgi:hypothetical protein